MDDFHNEVIRAMIRHLDAADESNYLIQMSNLVSELAKLARYHWEKKNNLWQLSKPIWNEMRERLALHERLKKPDEPSTALWLQSGLLADLRHIILLAEIAARSPGRTLMRSTKIHAIKPERPQLRYVARKELERFLS